MLAGGLEPQQQPGQRLVDLVVEVARDSRALLLLGVEGGARRSPALGLEPLEHADEGAVQTGDLLRPGRRLHVTQVGAGPGEVGALHLIDEPLEGAEAPLQKDQVDRDAERDRKPEHERGLWIFAEVDVRVRRQDRGDDRGDDQHQVDDQHLGEQIAPSHAPSIEDGRAASRP